MVSIYRPVRQFERGFLSHTDLSEPPDDRKNSDDIYRHPRPDINPNLLEGSKLIATITYNHNKKTVNVERV